MNSLKEDLFKIIWDPETPVNHSRNSDDIELVSSSQFTLMNTFSSSIALFIVEFLGNGTRESNIKINFSKIKIITRKTQQDIHSGIHQNLNEQVEHFV